MSEFCIIKYGAPRSKKQWYIAINENTGETFADIKHFPNTCILCAMADGTTFLEMGVGKRNIRRTFLSLKWLAYDWGGPKEIEEELQKKEKHFQKHWKEIISCDEDKFKELTSC